MKISFHGASRDVTGSCHLVETRGKKLLIDCGAFQGGNGKEKLNESSFGFNPADVDYLLLTHAHLDHCGRIPLLRKRGFEGEIIATSPSIDLAELIMRDSAKLQAEDASRKKKNTGNHVEPIYRVEDVEEVMELFGRNVSYGETIQLSDDIFIKFIDAGHILGSGSIELEIKEGKSVKKITFSGDIGNNGRPIVNDPTLPSRSNIVVMETTYGDRLHRPITESIVEFYNAIQDTFDRGGNVIIPTFAVERAQELLFFLKQGINDGILPKDMKVFLDSPMAINATKIYAKHKDFYDEETLKYGNPFAMPNLHFTRTVEESKAINETKSGAVILAGSGMCHGGRILHHLKNHLPNPNSGIIFINYASKNSIPGKIVRGAKTVRIFKEDVPVKAKIYTINGFSAHAGQDGLYEWHKSASPDVTFLVHGDKKPMSTFAKGLPSKGHVVEKPMLHQSFQF